MSKCDTFKIDKKPFNIVHVACFLAFFKNGLVRTSRCHSEPKFFNILVQGTVIMSQQQKATPTLNRTLNATLWKRRLMATTAMTLAGVLAMNSSAFAVTASETPTNGNVVGGTATIAYSGPNNRDMIVTQQNTIRTVIDWNTFNVGRNASAEFKQLSTSSTTINRVTGSTDPSQILGTLKSTVNGQTGGTIMILDPNGVLFGANAKIDVGSIIASTGNLNNQQRDAFLAGETFQLRNLDSAGNNTVENRGRITAAQGGLVALVAPVVKNSGVINANLGTVLLGSGRQVTFDFYGDGLIHVASIDNSVETSLVENSGEIFVAGGTAIMSANAARGVVDSVVNMSGVINADSFSTHNGKIVLTSGNKVNVSGTLQARRETTNGNANTAGEISITGQDVVISDTAKILADITGTKRNPVAAAILGPFNPNGRGDGGSVYIWGTDSIVFAGHIDISGGEANGNGGFAEVSGNNELAYRGTVDASAKGTRGTLLIDPMTVKIGNSMFDPVVNAASLAETLGLTNVHIVAGDKIMLVDDVDLSHWGFGGLLVTNGDLTLEAPTVDLVKDLTMGNGKLAVDADTINLDGMLYSNTVPVVNNPLFNVALGSEKLSGTASVVNVLSDKASIQQGIHVATNDGGATVFVASGNYNENINIYKSLTLQGAAGPTQPLLFGTNILGDVVVVSANNVTVDGFEIIAETAPWFIPSLRGIVANNVSNLTLSNNTITGPMQSGISLNNVNGATLSNNRISSVLTGIDVKGGSNISLLSNTILTTATGINLLGANFVNVVSNIMNTALVSGIQADNSTDLDIRDNTISNTLDGIKLNNIQDSKIAANDVSLSVRDGVNVTNSSNVDVDNNIITLAGRYGVSVVDTNNVSVDENLVVGTGNSGIFVDPSSGSVTGNTIIGASNHGIESIDNNDFLIANNTIIGAVNDGIFVSGGTDITVESNTVLGVGGNGISVDGTNQLSVSDNDVGLTGGNGIDVKNATGASIFANLIAAVFGHGVSVANTNASTIENNIITLTGGDGISAEDSDFLRIDGNDISLAGDDGIGLNNVSGAGVTGNTITASSDNGIEARAVIATNISGNTVLLSGNNGIDVTDASLLLVAGNTLAMSANNGIQVNNILGTALAGNVVALSGNNAIDIENAQGAIVLANVINAAGRDGISVNNGSFTAILANDIRNIGRNGVNLISSIGTVIAFNNIQDGLRNAIRISNSILSVVGWNTLDNFYNGIRVGVSFGTALVANQIDNMRNDGIQVSFSNLTGLFGNNISGYADDGVQVANSNGVLIANNNIDGQNIGQSGIRIGRNEPSLLSTISFSGSENLIISNNLISNNQTGLSATAQNNGAIDIRGNNFVNNITGLEIHSGVIDLTQAPNIFTGGQVALSFSGPFAPSGGYTGLRLVNNTIGETVFEGQSDFYIRLANGAFFAPGTPTLIDGTQATYDGVFGGLMTFEQYLAIEAKIFDFDDDNSLGQIFAGFVNLDDNQILRRFANNQYRSGRASILINGLPNTSLSNTATRPAPFFNVQDLANLMPAAGDDEGDIAKRLSGIEPAAGNSDGGFEIPAQDVSNSACWGNFSGGQGFSMDLGGDPTAILADVAACNG